MMTENRFIEPSNIHDALLTLYPKISRYELETIVFLIRNKDWTRIRKISLGTSIPRTKVYGVTKKLHEGGLIEEKMLKPNIKESWSSRRRSQAMREQGFNPQGDAKGFKVIRARSDVILEKLNWLLPCLKALQTSLS